jgi:hypothetical protein
MKTLQLLEKLQKAVFDEEIAGHIPHQLLVDIKDHIAIWLPLDDELGDKIYESAAEEYEDEGRVFIEQQAKIEVIKDENGASEEGAWVQAWLWVSLEDES